jgi:hypothetical protein
MPLEADEAMRGSCQFGPCVAVAEEQTRLLAFMVRRS